MFQLRQLVRGEVVFQLRQLVRGEVVFQLRQLVRGEVGSTAALLRLLMVVIAAE